MSATRVVTAATVPRSALMHNAPLVLALVVVVVVAPQDLASNVARRATLRETAPLLVQAVRAVGLHQADMVAARASAAGRRAILRETAPMPPHPTAHPASGVGSQGTSPATAQTHLLAAAAVVAWVGLAVPVAGPAVERASGVESQGTSPATAPTHLLAAAAAVALASAVGRRGTWPAIAQHHHELAVATAVQRQSVNGTVNGIVKGIVTGSVTGSVTVAAVAA